MSKRATNNKAAALGAGLAIRGGTQAGRAAAVAVSMAIAPNLSPTERLAGLEAVLAASEESYLKARKRHLRDVGSALREIRDDELFADAGHATFEEYLATRWGWDRSYGTRLIDLARIAEALTESPLGTLTDAALVDLNEAQARALANIDRDHGRPAMLHVWAVANGLESTAVEAVPDRPELEAGPAGNTPRFEIGTDGQAPAPVPAQEPKRRKRITAKGIADTARRLYSIPAQGPAFPEAPAEGDIVDAEIVEEHEESEAAPATPALDRLEAARDHLTHARRLLKAKVFDDARAEGDSERYGLVLDELRKSAVGVDGVTERVAIKERKLRAAEQAEVPTG